MKYEVVAMADVPAPSVFRGKHADLYSQLLNLPTGETHALKISVIGGYPKAKKIRDGARKFLQSQGRVLLSCRAPGDTELYLWVQDQKSIEMKKRA